MDAILSDILQMLDEHYGVIMMFDALSKELYSLKQGLGEKVAEFGVCLSQQIQVLQNQSTQEGFGPNMWRRWSYDLLLWGPLILNTGKCWLIS